jgi:hypothetical protein
MLSVTIKYIMLNVVMLSLFMLNVIMLNIVAPFLIRYLYLWSLHWQTILTMFVFVILFLVSKTFLDKSKKGNFQISQLSNCVTLNVLLQTASWNFIGNTDETNFAGNVRAGHGTQKGKVSLYSWPPVWPVRISLFYKKRKIVIQLIPNQSNRRSTVQWYFLSVPWLR